MAQRILTTTGEAILPGEDDILHQLTKPLSVYLPPIGDGTGGTVVAGWAIQLTTENLGSLEVLSNKGSEVATIGPRNSKLVVAVADWDGWSVSDLPLMYPGDQIVGGIPPGAHTHPISEVVGLQAGLDGKAAAAHTHVIANVTDLQTTLDGKAAAVHSHLIADTTGLQASLDAKAAAVHTHAQADVTGLVTALADKSAVGHIHAASEIVSGVLAAARIATGTPDGTKFLRDDQVWTVPGGGGAHAASHQNGGADEVNVAGLSGLLADGQTPLAHAASHKSGGADAIKLDELAAPTDVTTLNASLSAHGLLQKLPGGTTNFLRADGTFAAPPGGGGGGSTYLYKAADQTISAAGFVDITDFTFAVEAAKAYAIEAYIVFQSSATTMGVLIGFNGPASPALVSLRSRKEITAVATAGTDKFSEAIISAYDTANPLSTAEIAAAANLTHEFKGVFVNGANAGTFAFRLSKENVAGNATIKAGSWVRFKLLN